MSRNTAFEFGARPGRRPCIFRRGVLENLAVGVIAAGVIMLMQPFSLTLYGWSFVTMLAGVVLFTIVGRFSE